nr:MAG TPA: hypothetical protein [Caudoviricetes sp.]
MIYHPIIPRADELLCLYGRKIGLVQEYRILNLIHCLRRLEAIKR